MTINNYEDQAVREKALNPAESFIVQAPAGSGKTELLTQRFLRLLAFVNSPEEIIAITFTRKAAAQMRTRITSSLAFANEQPKPDESYKALRWELAQKALKQDQKLNWHLLDNPNRLRILTIDALSAVICARTPLLSGFGGQPNIIEDPNPCYQEAARALLTSKENNPEIETLLLHLDNNIEQLESLLTEILAYREQWLPHIIDHYQNPDLLKADLQTGLANIGKEKMHAVRTLIENEAIDDLIVCAQFAGKYLSHQDPGNPIVNCAELKQLPGIKLNDFPMWSSIARLLLTTNNQWRKSVDKRCGFPAEKQHKTIKSKFLNLLDTMRDNEALKSALSDILICPPIHYTEKQWKITQALINLLPQLAAELQVIFMDRGMIDFTELTLGALRALGEASQPTDLALHLDYKICHLLIDEFQDTSVIQFRLIEQLLCGWQRGDGRTLFLVGDPMQSIYRFRNAEVGLFLRTQQQGLANISLKPLTLKSNFRSNINIVNWINSVFDKVFPTNSDTTVGAVPYSPAIATQNNQHNSVVHYPLLQANTGHESQQIVDIINNCQQQNPQSTIAILIRSRSQSIDIIPMLRAANIQFYAIDIETLAHRTEIQDLLSLTRALLYLEDRIAWLAILRAPWCGLTLHDLHILTQHCGKKPIWASLIEFSSIQNLSNDAKMRLERIIPLLERTIKNEKRLSFSSWIQGTWLALGGPACLNSLSKSDNAKTYFKLLQEIEDDFSLELLENKLKQLYTNTPSHEQSNVQIMTIHKAKGLEFDHVIIPGLQQKTPSDKNRLLMWLDRPCLQGGSDLILAPIRAANESQDGIYNYLKTVEKTKLDYEMARLLYVAVTRAKSTLHLISCVENNEDKTDELIPAKKGSLLNLLWEPCINEIKNHVKLPKNTTSKSKNLKTPKLLRLKKEWQLPIPIKKISSSDKKLRANINCSIMQKQQSYLGIVIHEILETIATEGIKHWNSDRINKEKSHWQRRLTQLGTLPKYLNSHVSLAAQAINNILNDPKGQWMLSQEHQESYSEYPITAINNNELIKCIIDRTFIDKNNARWIIDYKTAIPTKETLEQFLITQKELHSDQLHQYAQLFKTVDHRTIKLGLYFPLCSAWCEWDYQL